MPEKSLPIAFAFAGVVLIAVGAILSGASIPAILIVLGIVCLVVALINGG